MEPRAVLWHATALSLLGHAVVLSQLRAILPDAAPHGQARPAVFTVSVREATVVAAAPAPAEAIRPPSPPAAAKADQQRTEPAPKAPALTPAAPPPPEPRPEAISKQPAQDEPYLPRGQLTVTPKPIGMVQVPFPDEVTGLVDLKVQLTLFIDETGTVQRIRVDTPDVHPAFERAIRDAFGPARFSPGEMQHVAVRSQMRVEVEFHAPPQGPAVNAGSRPPRS